MTSTGDGPRDLREDLRQQIRRPGVLEQMNAALLKEATEGAKSGTSVIRAYELVSKILDGEDRRDPSGGEDLSLLSDADLRDLLRRLERDDDG